MIQPHEIQIGSIIMSNNIHCIVDGILKDGFISTDKGSGHLDEFSAIPLTEKILTEWCGFHKVEENQYRLGFKLIVIRDGKFFDYGTSVELPYLHILQRFILALTNEPLKITLK
jgi:hypothetical protein